MARDGSGDYSRPVTPPSNGEVASATDFNTEMDDIASALSDSINKAGTKAFAANQPMGGFKLTGLAAGASNGDSVRYEQLTALSSVYQPLDAQLTEVAGRSPTSGDVFYYTGATSAAAQATTSYGRSYWNVANLTALVGIDGAGSWRNALGCGTMATASQADYAALAGATFTGNVVINKSTPVLRLQEGGVTKAQFFVDGTDVKVYAASGQSLVLYANDVIYFTINTSGVLVDSNGGKIAAPPAVSSETSGTLTAASRNRIVEMSGNCTINDGVFTAKDWIIFINNSGSTRQIVQDSGMTLRLHGTTTTGDRTIAVRGGAPVYFNSNSDAIVFGDVT